MTTAAQNSKQLLTPKGSAATPSHSFLGNNTTGWYLSATNEISAATNATQRLVIDSSGNVGIGTSSPSTYGRFVISGGDGNTLFNVGASGLLRISGYNSAYSGASFESTNTTQTGYAPITINGSYTVVATGGSERMRIDSSGNVGIGTSSPGNRLHLYGSTNATSGISIQNTGGSGRRYTIYSSTAGGLYFANDTGGGDQMVFDASGNLLVGRTSSSGLPASSGNIQIADNIANGSYVIGGFGSFLGRQASDGSTVLNTGQAAIIFSRGAYGSTTESMRIDGSGNVGIGVTPSATGGQLQVFGAGNRASAQFGGNANGMSVLSQNGLTVYTNLSAGSVDTTLVAGNTATTYMAFGIHNGTSYSERMRIDSSGNLLVGTTTSNASLLTVAGPIALNAPTTKTANYSMAATDSSLIFNGAGSITLTLQAASSYTGRMLYVKTIAAQTVVSASSNVVPVGSATAGTAILAATAGKWAILQSDGTNWVIMAAN